MTTIACDGQSMSSDSLESAGDVIVGTRTKKLWKLSDGRIFGGAGKVNEVMKLLDWLEENPDNDYPPKLKDASALILYPDGKLLMYDGGGVIVTSDIPAAIGTGFISALTAMDLGHDTRTAVKMAIKRDVFSGGAIQTLRL